MNSEMRPVRVAPKAVIVEDGRLLTVHMRGSKGEYYMFPGGGHETGETLEDTLRRECVEEIGCDVELGRVLWLRDYREKNHEFADIRPGFHQLRVLSGDVVDAQSESGASMARTQDEGALAKCVEDEDAASGAPGRR